VILIGYDGSRAARSALKQAARLIPGERAIVLTVWEPCFEVVPVRPDGLSHARSVVRTDGQAETASESAARHADQGARLARRYGLDATGRVCPRDNTTAAAIRSEANRADAALIVVGSRGRRGLRAALAGSVSNELLRHADRALMVVPAP
jgi:nucleotide-binding universal stress UspA family protein